VCVCVSIKSGGRTIPRNNNNTHTRTQSPIPPSLPPSLPPSFPQSFNALYLAIGKEEEAAIKSGGRTIPPNNNHIFFNFLAANTGEEGRREGGREGGKEGEWVGVGPSPPTLTTSSSTSWRRTQGRKEGRREGGREEMLRYRIAVVSLHHSHPLPPSLPPSLSGRAHPGRRPLAHAYGEVSGQAAAFGCDQRGAEARVSSAR